uniref:Xaa-Pro aminopeptidase 1 n=1 Tax=Trichuris muris TaxID=70415 RepID=A0A5S6QDN6_TRIMR
MGSSEGRTLLERLRAVMQNAELVPEKLDAYIVPSGDAHNSEYTALCDRRRAFITGFTGSRGTAVVTRSTAALWTVGIYYLQASKQLYKDWILMKDGLSDTPTLSEWLIGELFEGSVVGIDPYVCSAEFFMDLSSKLSKGQIRLIQVSTNLVDCVWDTSRPCVPTSPLFQHSLEFAGLPWQTKVARVQESMKRVKAQVLLLSALDEIAWLFNIRGSDIPYTPLFFAYAVITDSSVSLFVHSEKVSAELEQYLTSPWMTVTLEPYDSVRKCLSTLVGRKDVQRIWLPPETNYALFSAVPQQIRFVEQSPLLNMKAVKNETEIRSLREAHAKDSVALCIFLHWLDRQMLEARACVTELSAAEKIEECRRSQPLFLSPSFETISASGSNASIIHYKPTEETNAQLNADRLFLIDSGGQYHDGTTDVTRTVMFEGASEFEKDCYTRVLKGHIALASLVFPDKCSGVRLDSVARRYLWEKCLDYMHGTGHGVGMCLSVHEGPCGFGTISRVGYNSEGIRSNMVLTIEPGFYKDDEFGIRIENAYLVKTVADMSTTESAYLCFEPLTLVPIQQKLILSSLLSQQEIDWINRYHDLCRDVIGPRLQELGYMDVYRWLIQETMPIG